MQTKQSFLMPGESPYLAAYYLCLAAVGVMAAVLGPTLQALAEQTHSSLQQSSLVLAMRPAGYMAGALLLGRLYDRLPGHPLMAWSLVLAGLSLALIPLMPSLGLLAALVLVMGFADGCLDLGTNTLLPWVFKKRSPPILNGLHFAFGLGAFATPVVIAKVMGWGGLTWSYWVLALAMLPLAAFFALLKSPPHLPEKGSKPAAPVKPGLAALIILLFLCYGGAESGFGGWIYSYAAASGLTDPAGAAYLTSIFWGCLALGRLAGLGLALVAPLGAILALDLAGSLLALGAMLIWPQSPTALWLGSAGTGLFLASFFPTLLAYAARRLAPEGRISGALTSLFFLGSGCGSIVVPWLIGQGFEARGPWLAPAAVLGAVLGAAILFMMIAMSKDGRRR